MTNYYLFYSKDDTDKRIVKGRHLFVSHNSVIIDNKVIEQTNNLEYIRFMIGGNRMFSIKCKN